MAENELLASGRSPLGLDAVEAVGAQDLWLPPAAPGPEGIEAENPWLRSRLIRHSPDGPGFSYVGRRFTLSVNSDLDVEFEFDPDPDSDPECPEEVDLGVGITLLVLVVWCIGVTLGIRFDRRPEDPGG